jgi:hemolysin activation/secretion protein
MGTVEVRYNLPDWWNFSQAQLYVFTDGAEMFNRVPSAGFPNWGHAASAGGGIRSGFLGFLTTDLTVAKAVNGPIDDTRFFFAATARY